MSSDDDKTKIILTPDGVGPGTQLNGIYEIDERIASGGMGEVYRGHNIQTEQPVAIKIVLPEFARDKTILALFRKEATILSHLSHDAIVRYHVFTIDPTIARPYLAMEFVSGESLADHLKRGPLDPDSARRLIQRVAAGLAAAHEAGVVHRDLSPDNIILPDANFNKAKIIDFGIAKAATGEATLIGGKFAGKYNFVSPEQLGDFGGEITAQSDIYSLGLVFAAALRGEALDMGGSQVEVIEKRRRMPDLSELDPTLRPVIEAMLQANPADRPPDMHAIVGWLASLAPVGSGFAGDPSRSYGGAGQSAAPVSYAPRQSMPPASSFPPPGSVPPPGSRPPYGSAPPPGSAPPYGGAPYGSQGAASAPPASESPFGPGPSTPPAASLPPRSDLAGSRPSTTAAPRSKTGLYAAVAALVLVAAGAGAWFSGAFGDRTAPDASGQSAAAPPSLQPPATPEPGEPPAAEPEVEEEVAAAPVRPEVTPPPEPSAPAQPEPPAAPLDNAAAWIDWLRNYDGGECFYATPTSVTNAAFELEGFATSAAPFETMLSSFRQTYDLEPEIGVRVIAAEQCAVADFLHAMREGGEDRPLLTLSTDIIRSGDAIRGALENLEGRQTDILLIDNAGVVYNLGQHLRPDGDRASFNIKLGLNSPDPVPQIIVAIASRENIAAADVQQPVLASQLFPRILEEIRSRNLDASATAKYFRLGG